MIDLIFIKFNIFTPLLQSNEVCQKTQTFQDLHIIQNGTHYYMKCFDSLLKKSILEKYFIKLHHTAKFCYLTNFPIMKFSLAEAMEEPGFEPGPFVCKTKTLPFKLYPQSLFQLSKILFNSKILKIFWKRIQSNFFLIFFYQDFLSHNFIITPILQSTKYHFSFLKN